MKKLFLLGFAVILFAACQNNQKQFTRTSLEIDVAKALLKDYHAGDWEAWATHYADTAKIFHNTWDESKGTTPEETANSLKAILNNMSSYHFEEEDDLPWYEMVTNDKGSTWVYFWGNWKGTLAANNKELKIIANSLITTNINDIDGRQLNKFKKIVVPSSLCLIVPKLNNSALLA